MSMAVNTPRGDQISRSSIIRSLRASLAGVVACGALLVGVTSAQAGSNYYDTSKVSPPVSGFSGLLPDVRDDNSAAAKAAPRFDLTDDLSSSPLPLNFHFVDTTAALKNASARDETPLLIPLPSAVVTGALGLLGVALLLASRRFRQRFFN